MASTFPQIDFVPPARSSRHCGHIHRIEDAAPDTRRILEAVKFVIIGAQKGGTTWLSDVIKQHEGAFIPTQKELHFFNVQHNYDTGPETFTAFFEDAMDGRVLGEATPNYMWNYVTPTEDKSDDPYYHDVAPKLKALLPNAQLLVCLRDPVARAVSAHYHLTTRTRFSPFTPLRDVVRQYGVAAMSRYDLQLSHWYEHFPKEQIKVLVYEDDIHPDEKKLETANEVFRFIGLSEKEDFPELYERSNDKEKPALAYLRQLPGMKPRPYDWTRKMRFGERLAQAVSRRLPNGVQTMLDIKLSQADKDALKEYFEPHNRRLEDMLERKLPW